MRFKELIKKVAKKSSVSGIVADEIIKNMLLVMSDTLLSGDKVNLPKIGVLKLKEKAERKARNPKTGDIVIVPKRKRVLFSASTILNNKINT